MNICPEFFAKARLQKTGFFYKSYFDKGKKMTEKTEVFQYDTQGTCSKRIFVQIENGIVQGVEFLGGCQGNLRGIGRLVNGMKIDDVIERLRGIDCGGKGTSCPDQLARCLLSYKQRSQTPTFVK